MVNSLAMSSLAMSKPAMNCTAHEFLTLFENCLYTKFDINQSILHNRNAAQQRDISTLLWLRHQRIYTTASPSWASLYYYIYAPRPQWSTHFLRNETHILPGKAPCPCCGLPGPCTCCTGRGPCVAPPPHPPPRVGTGMGRHLQVSGKMYQTDSDIFLC